MLSSAKHKQFSKCICVAGPSPPARDKGKGIALSPQQQALQAACAAMQSKADSEERWVLPTPLSGPLLGGDVCCAICSPSLILPSWTVLLASSKYYKYPATVTPDQTYQGIGSMTCKASLQRLKGRLTTQHTSATSRLVVSRLGSCKGFSTCIRCRWRCWGTSQPLLLNHNDRHARPVSL